MLFVNTEMVLCQRVLVWRKGNEYGQIKWRRNELNLNIVSFTRDRCGLRIHQIMFFKKLKGYFYKVLYAQGD